MQYQIFTNNHELNTYLTQVKNEENESTSKALVLVGSKIDNTNAINKIQEFLSLQISKIDVEPYDKSQKFVFIDSNKIFLLEIENEKDLDTDLLKECVDKTFLIISAEKWNKDTHDLGVKRRTMVIPSLSLN
jgi:hypothetical protein